jgi:hypothetical protein
MTICGPAITAHGSLDPINKKSLSIMTMLKRQKSNQNVSIVCIVLVTSRHLSNERSELIKTMLTNMTNFVQGLFSCVIKSGKPAFFLRRQPTPVNKRQIALVCR